MLHEKVKCRRKYAILSGEWKYSRCADLRAVFQAKKCPEIRYALKLLCSLWREVKFAIICVFMGDEESDLQAPSFYDSVEVSQDPVHYDWDYLIQIYLSTATA